MTALSISWMERLSQTSNLNCPANERAACLARLHDVPVHVRGAADKHNALDFGL